ncbi:hypothetical protein DLM76_07195 [Leptospira yasudae]|nr:hypothetical protein DLM76_07195 [Leptospira yasudae]
MQPPIFLAFICKASKGKREGYNFKTKESAFRMKNPKRKGTVLLLDRTPKRNNLLFLIFQIGNESIYYKFLKIRGILCHPGISKLRAP